MSDLPSTVALKTQHVRGDTLKIYRTVYEDGKTRSLWTNYRSAVGSATQARCNARVEYAHVDDGAWMPVDRTTELRLGRVEQLWHQLTQADPQALESLLDELVKRVQPPKPEPVLAEPVKREAEALLKLDLLASSK
jgi:hypothetical protein